MGVVGQACQEEGEEGARGGGEVREGEGLAEAPVDQGEDRGGERLEEGRSTGVGFRQFSLEYILLDLKHKI